MFNPVEPFLCMQCFLCGLEAVEGPNREFYHKKFFASGAKRSAESIHRPLR